MLERMIPDLAKGNGRHEEVLLKYASDNNLPPAVLEKMAHAYNSYKSIAHTMNAPEGERDKLFDTIDGDELLKKYTSNAPQTSQAIGSPSWAIAQFEKAASEDSHVLPNFNVEANYSTDLLSFLAACAEEEMTKSASTEEPVVSAHIERQIRENEASKIAQESYRLSSRIADLEDQIKSAVNRVYDPMDPERAQRIVYSFCQLQGRSVEDSLVAAGAVHGAMGLVKQASAESVSVRTFIGSSDDSKLLCDYASTVLESLDLMEKTAAGTATAAPLTGRVGQGTRRGPAPSNSHTYAADPGLPKGGGTSSSGTSTGGGTAGDAAFIREERRRQERLEERRRQDRAEERRRQEREEDQEDRRREKAAEAEAKRRSANRSREKVAEGIIGDYEDSVMEGIQDVVGSAADTMGSAVDSIGRNVLNPGYRWAGRMIRTALTPGPDEHQKALDQAIDAEQATSAFNTLMLEDPVLADADPDQMYEVFKTILSVSPNSARDQVQLRSLLRTAAESTSLDPFSIKAMADVEKVRLQNRDMADKMNSARYARESIL